METSALTTVSGCHLLQYNQLHKVTEELPQYFCADSSFRRRWSGFPCCRRSGLEQPASLGYISSNPRHVQAAAENWTFHSLLWSAVFCL